MHSFLTGHRFTTERMMTVKSESWPACGAACLSLMKEKGRIPAENPDFSGTSALQKNRVSARKSWFALQQGDKWPLVGIIMPVLAQCFFSFFC